MCISYGDDDDIGLEADGMKDRILLGINEGYSDGPFVGYFDDSTDGIIDGPSLGGSDGYSDGFLVINNDSSAEK